MPDNLPLPDTSRFLLPDHAVIALEGPETTAFAQAQFANDAVSLAPGHWQWSAWLTPKGRVIALFALLKFAEDRIWLLLPDYPADLFAEQLRRFVFRRKLKISQREDLAVLGGFTASGAVQRAELVSSDDAWKLDFGTQTGPRSLFITPLREPMATDTRATTRWRANDLMDGLPRLDASQREQWTPQQLSLDRLHAYSVKKGCYPGQEIVARTHFLGKAKRGLALFSSIEPLAPGDSIADGGNAIGTVVSIAQGNEDHLALAVLPMERDKDVPLTSGGTPLHELALRGGLER